MTSGRDSFSRVPFNINIITFQYVLDMGQMVKRKWTEGVLLHCSLILFLGFEPEPALLLRAFSFRGVQHPHA
jgi:hypothetical protein